MQVKLLMSWDIIPEREQEYFEFVVREFVPGITRLGLTPTESWYAVYGDCPQILTAGVTDDLPTMQRILESEEWARLQAKLQKLVTNYKQKVIRATGGFQL